MPLALTTLAVVTVLVALTSEVFVESVQHAATTLGLSPAFVGFIVVAIVGGAAEMISAWSAAGKNRLDLSVGIALGSSVQIALFVAPVLVLLSYVLGPRPMDLEFWPGAVAMMLIATMTAIAGHQHRPLGVVHRRVGPDDLRDLRVYALSAAAADLLRRTMLRQLLLGGFVSVINIAIHSMIMATVVGVAQRAGAKNKAHPSLFLAAVMIPIVTVLMATHAAEVMIWAGAYALVDAAPENVRLVYFAFVNYTTLGYGDILPVDAGSCSARSPR